MLPTQHAALTAARGPPPHPSRLVALARRPVRGGGRLDRRRPLRLVRGKIRDLSLWRAYRFHRRRGEHPFRLHHPAVVVDAHRPLHAPALLLALTVLARRFPVLWPLVAGMLFHRLLDYAWSATHALGALRRRTWPAGKAGDPRRTYDGTAYQRTLK